MCKQLEFEKKTIIDGIIDDYLKASKPAEVLERQC
ncbi:unnamed protein product, partial [marine sediment metagenome]